MTSYIPVLSTTPPTVGSSKKLWSPDLFDYDTGAYPKSTPPYAVHYPVNGSNQVQFYESNAVGTNGTIQCNLSGTFGGIAYWQATFNVLTSPGGVFITSCVFKLSKEYGYFPGFESFPPWSGTFYTDAVGVGTTMPTGGGDQKISIAPGTYIIRFQDLKEYTEVSAGPPETFTLVETGPYLALDQTITVTGSTLSTVNFTKP
jgi:hypothetical protein